MRLLDLALSRLGYVNEKALAYGPSMMSALGPGVPASARPTIHNMRDYLGRYADQAWMYSCIRVIQTKGAGVPLKIYKRMPNGELDEQSKHPLKLLLDNPDPFMTGYDLMESTHGFKGIVGNAYWLLDEFVNGLPTKIYPLNPARVKVRADKDKYIIGYVYEPSPGVDPTPLDVSEVLHFKTWNPNDDYYGMPPISAARDASDSIKGADAYNRMFFENAAEPGGILTSDQPIQEPTAQRILASWKKLHQGQRKAHKIALMDSGMKWQSTALSQKDMQFPELKKMSREDVLTVYGVPPVMVGVYDQGATYNTAQEQRRIFWVDTMIPELRKLEGVINMRLVQPWDPTLVARYDVSEIEALQKDEKFRAEADKTLIESGVMTINEIRKIRKLDKVEWGDVWHAPINLSPVAMGDDEPTPGAPEPKPGKPGAPPQDNPAGSEQDTPQEAINADSVQTKAALRREALWRAFKSTTEARERRWRGALSGLFNLQERAVKAKLRTHWVSRSAQARLDGGKTTKSSVEAIIFSGSDARKMFRKTGRQLLEVTLEQSAADEAQRWGLVALDLANPRVQTWLDDKAFKFADEVNSTTEDALRAALEAGVKDGDSIDKISAAVGDVFDMARGYRSDAIARTEVVGASNRGAMELYTENGVEQVEWVSSRDEKVRETHQIDGEVTGTGDTFSNGLEFPGDPDGAPEEVINCRCTVAPVKGD